jgi:hypothetical protein
MELSCGFRKAKALKKPYPPPDCHGLRIAAQRPAQVQRRDRAQRYWRPKRASPALARPRLPEIVGFPQASPSFPSLEAATDHAKVEGRFSGILTQVKGFRHRASFI